MIDRVDSLSPRPVSHFHRQNKEEKYRLQRGTLLFSSALLPRRIIRANTMFKNHDGRIFMGDGSGRLGRRRFLKRLALGTVAPTILPSRVLGRNAEVSPGDKITMGLIGCGGHGHFSDGPCAGCRGSTGRGGVSRQCSRGYLRFQGGNTTGV